MAFRWRADNGLMNAGLVGRTSIPMDSYSFVILRGRGPQGGGGAPDPLPPNPYLDPHMYCITLTSCNKNVSMYLSIHLHDFSEACLTFEFLAVAIVDAMYY